MDTSLNQSKNGLLSMLEKQIYEQVQEIKQLKSQN